MTVTNLVEAPVAAKTPVLPLGEERVLLHNISWQTYERLLTELGDNRNCRLAYDRGTLEIMSPLLRHEGSNRLIHDIIRIMAGQLKLNLRAAGSMTCKREDLERGLEPDSSFYIQNEPLVRQKGDLDLAIDPPPDLMIEVDISRSSMSKFPICSALGVPEIWRYDGTTLSMYKLAGQEYTECDASVAFAGLALRLEVPRVIARSFEIGETAALEEFRAWVNKQIAEKK